MEMFADDLASLLDGLNIRKKVVLCGLSMGGYVAFAFYRKFPTRVGALILTATRAANDSPQAREARDQAAETARTKGIQAVVNGLLPRLLAPNLLETNPTLAEQVRSIMLKTSLTAMLGDLEGMKNRTDSRPYLNQIKAPTLILHGAEDQLIPAQEARDMHAALPNARLQFIPRAGHLLNMEQPALFNAALRGFLAGLAIDELP
jgi:pimeloyl-ACP methyl ester carboxylesterase